VIDETTIRRDVSWVASAQGSDFPDPEPAARHLLGGQGPAPAGRRDRRLCPRPRRHRRPARRGLARGFVAAGAQRLARARAGRASRAAPAPVELLSDERYRDDVEPQLIGQSEVRMHVPCLIGDYTDFYVGIHHATNVGKQFRPDNPLLPNYKYVPIGYHGRASSVRASGEPVIRPKGQRKAPDADAPEYGPSRRLDYELELGMWIGRGNELGRRSRSARRRAYRRLLPAQRLVGARPPGVGISAARPVPRQEFPDQRRPGWSAPRRSRRSASRCRRGPPATRSRCPISTTMPTDRESGGLGIQLEATLSTEQMRAAGLRRTCCRAARRTRRCTGARRRSSPITAPTAATSSPAT
jgi:fumarylacetoacetase